MSPLCFVVDIYVCLWCLRLPVQTMRPAVTPDINMSASCALWAVSLYRDIHYVIIALRYRARLVKPTRESESHALYTIITSLLGWYHFNLFSVLNYKGDHVFSDANITICYIYSLL